MSIKSTGGSYPLSMRRGLRLAGVLSAAVHTHATPIASTTAPPQLPSHTAMVMSYYGSRGASSRSARVLRHRVSAGLVSSTSLRPAADGTCTRRPTSTSCTAAGAGRCSINGGSITTAIRRPTPVPTPGRVSSIYARMRNHLSMSARETSRSVAGCPAAEVALPAWAGPRRRRRGTRAIELSAATQMEAVTGQVVGDDGRPVVKVERDDSGLDGHDEQENSMKMNLLEMSDEEIQGFIQSIGEPKYRAGQVLKWLYDGGALSFDDMTNLPKTLRAKLAKVATVGALEVAAQQTSKDGTRKRAYRLADGQLIESVLMPYSDGRRTACISSQAGCAMGCVFCATGQMGFKRQLTSAEIFEQAYRFAQELSARGERLTNVVFMGMGEPLANYNSVMEAVRRINKELGIGARHITISTVGLAPRILRLAEENIQVKLAVSLHAANDRERSALLPANRRFPLADLMEACKTYVKASGRRMTFEWALIHGENDSREVAAELGRFLEPLKGMCHVNIIPLNPTAGYDGGPSMAEAVEDFVSVLARYSVPATPRMRRGIDIDAGCGQLTVKVNREDVLGKGL